MENISSNQENVIKEFRETQLPQFNEFMDNKWLSWMEDKEFKLVYRDEESGIRSIKSETVINTNSKTVFDFVKDLSNKHKYDSTFEKSLIHEKIDDNFSIVYLKHKGLLIVSPRDFVNLVYSNYTEDKSIYLITSTKDEMLPEYKGIVRGEIFYAGFLVDKITENQSKLTFFSSVNVKLNQTLVNTNLKSVSYCVNKIKKLLE